MKKYLILAFLVILLKVPVFAKVWINEVHISDDWVELWNDGDEAVDLSGWGLSDNKKTKKLFKWKFPIGTLIEPNEYKLIDLSVAGFGISNDDDGVFLTPFGDSVPADSCPFTGDLPEDCSFGRGYNRELAYYATPTPGCSNNEMEYSRPLGLVAVSVERGIYTKPFDVTLSYPDNNVEIFYTTDHSEPLPSNGTLYDGTPIHISGTTVLRAKAISSASLPAQNITSHSYIFLNDILTQQKPSIAPDVWTDWGSTKASYTISTNVVYDAATKQQFFDAITNCPIVSITMSDEAMFNPQDGLYTKPNTCKVMGVERMASVEWLNGKYNFGVNAGIKIQGNTSTSFEYTPKKSFRLCFRSKYGAGKLKYPVLEENGCNTVNFSSLILRGENSCSWAGSTSPELGTSMRDQFQRDLQGEISGYKIAGTNVGLFLNGMYWGIYNLCERNDADSASEKFGGNKEDYNVLNNFANERNGSSAPYKEYLTWLYYNDMSNNTNYQKALSELAIDDFIDYLIIRSYSGDYDWPEYNWEVVHNPVKGVPYCFFVWDAEYGLRDHTWNPLEKDLPLGKWSPNVIHLALKANADYRLRFADRLQKLVFNPNAVLSTNGVARRYAEAAAKVRPTIFAEAARWGAYRHDAGLGTRIYGMDDWDTVTAGITNDFAVKRILAYKRDMTAKGLYTALSPATITYADEPALTATISVPNGAKCYYTIDGTDPRLDVLGEVSDSAFLYQNETKIRSAKGSTVKVRAFADGTWSAMTEIMLAASGGKDPMPDAGEYAIRNIYLPVGTGGEWDIASNWHRGYCPISSNAWAAITNSCEVTIRNNPYVGRLEVSNYVNLHGAIHVRELIGSGRLGLELGASTIDIDESQSISEIRLFITKVNEGVVFRGGVASTTNLLADNVKVFVLSSFGTVPFFGQFYREEDNAQVEVEQNGKGRWQYKVTIPQQGEYERAFSELTSKNPVDFKPCDTVIYNESKHIITINGFDYLLKPYHNAQLNDHQLSVTLNSTAIPKYAPSQTQDISLFEESDGQLFLRVKTEKGLYYSILYKQNIEEDWLYDSQFTQGNGQIMQLPIPELSSRTFYKVAAWETTP